RPRSPAPIPRPPRPRSRAPAARIDWPFPAPAASLRAMTPLPLTFSDDQAEAWDRLALEFEAQGIDLAESALTPQAEGRPMVMAITGKAGSGKTMLLAGLYKALREAGVEVISADWEGK